MIGIRFKQLRLVAGYKSLRKLSIASGVTLSTLSRIESGKHGTVSANTLSKVAPFLNIGKDELLELSGQTLNEISADYAPPAQLCIPVLHTFDKSKPLNKQTDISELFPIQKTFADGLHFALKANNHNSGGYIGKNSYAIVKHCSDFNSGDLVIVVRNCAMYIRKALRTGDNIVFLTNSKETTAEIQLVADTCIAGVIIAKFELI
ncbi:MAG: helix-turn-helix domain-containing protein [Bacillota bacterium]